MCKPSSTTIWIMVCTKNENQHVAGMHAKSEGKKFKLTKSLTTTKCNIKESMETLHLYTRALNHEQRTEGMTMRC